VHLNEIYSFSIQFRFKSQYVAAYWLHPKAITKRLVKLKVGSLVKSAGVFFGTSKETMSEINH